MKKALLIDFADSFTWNLVQELELQGFKTTVQDWRDVEELNHEGLLVLGPGPGHPDDYQRLFPALKKWLAEGKPFFGVCLGHQIFWRLRDEMVVRSRDPRHGQKIELLLSPRWQEFFASPGMVTVQRYNSLAVPAQAALRHPDTENLIFEDEIYISRGWRFLTYQFHPESVGTSFREAFFIPLEKLLV